jgi:hypothetical protein
MQNTTKLMAGHPPKKTEEGEAAGPALGEKILNHGWSSAVLQLQLRTVISVLKKSMLTRRHSMMKIKRGT